MPRLLNNRSPVNWRHPLNRGRLLWLKSVPNPGWSRGLTFRDLVGLSARAAYPGTLTNGPAWAGSLGRPGGSGCLSFDGTDDYVSVSASLFDTLFLASASAKVASAASWIRPTGSLTAYQAVFDASTGGSDRQLSAFLGGAANHLFVAFAGSAGTEITLSDSWVANAWQRLLVTCDGTTITVYRNGLSVGSAAAGVGINFTSASGAWRVGSNPPASVPNFVGQQDSVSVWGRCLSAAHAAADYRLERLRHPPMLNWSRPSVLFTGPAGGAATYTATAAFTAAPATLAASATFAPGTHTGAAVLTAKGATLAAAATFSPGTHTAAATLTAGHATLAASATFAPGTHTATATLTAKGATLTASAVFASGVFQATAALAAKGATLSAATTFSVPTRTGVASLATAPATLSAFAAFVAPTYSGTAALVAAAARLSATDTAAILGPYYVDAVQTLAAGAIAAETLAAGATAAETGRNT